ncbi:hypothetical protein GCM10010191_07110 [Actinomadura vinacea]|uniref:PqqD family protein n=1 Tax=Actinomadura vinacea TaxID=115336 RepID=A0ABN3IEG1_9ACTN
MTHYTIAMPYLDECGGVYIPGLGDDGAAVRLNQRGSALWRDLAATGTCDIADLPEDGRAFVQLLIARGVIRPSEDMDGIDADRIS